jgi:hypothetical protein
MSREPPSQTACIRIASRAGIGCHDAYVEELVLEPERIDARQLGDVEAREIAEVVAFG